MDFKHVSVLLDEVIDSLQIKENGIYVDCTLGGAGHSLEILNKLSSKGRLIGIDQDRDALNFAKEKLDSFDNVTFVHDNFYNIDRILSDLNIEKVDGILMDLGVSSYQLDNADRGFSYMKEAYLDMRMNREDTLTAFQVVNEYTEKELIRVLREYGEEKFAPRIVRNIMEKRKEKDIETTIELANIIKTSIPMKFQKSGHPAKKTFQAIRIEVNNELGILKKTVLDAIERLDVDGRISIITFHSLEDRIVKRAFSELKDPCTCPKDFPYCVCGKEPKISIITKKPIEPSDEEKESNSRSKSSKLRVARKISSN